MIERYSNPEMAEIFSDQSRLQIWLEVEGLALEKMVEEGLAPSQALKDYREKAKFDVARVLQIEEEVKHDVIAFLTNVAEYIGPSARFVHRGMTSSDLLDTTLAVQLRRAGHLLLRNCDGALQALLERARDHKLTPCIGRSHGIHAEPTTFGLKLLGFYVELKRARKRLDVAIDEVSHGKISGAVGTYASLPPSVELHVMNKLGLKPDTVSTQVVSRDRHAAFFNALALMATTIEHCAVEIRHLQRTEVGEAEEKFSVGQKGSSAMPHKRNPVLSENLSGLARLVRAYSHSAMENIVLWHERDISHSSVERVIAPDACILLDFMLRRFKGLIKGLVIYPERMMHNLNLTRGLIFSGTLLVKLVDVGVTREDAYRMVQKHAMAAFELGGPDFKERVMQDPDFSSMLDPKVLAEVFDLKRHFKHVDMIFDRALRE